jgi:cytoskeletal protein CcmA (bactofilin family)
MFKENQPLTANETDTIIGPSVKVEGDFITEGNIIIEGIICGTIKTTKNLKIGPQSKIFSNVWAENALVAGEVQGNINCNNKLELTATAKIFGDIKAAILNVASGAIISGKCQTGDNKTKAGKPEFSKQEKIELKPINEEAESPLKPKIKK